jgi:hypothetical protein
MNQEWKREVDVVDLYHRNRMAAAFWTAVQVSDISKPVTRVFRVSPLKHSVHPKQRIHFVRRIRS